MPTMSAVSLPLNPSVVICCSPRRRGIPEGVVGGDHTGVVAPMSCEGTTRTRAGQRAIRLVVFGRPGGPPAGRTTGVIMDELAAIREELRLLRTEVRELRADNEELRSAQAP